LRFGGADRGGFVPRVRSASSRSWVRCEEELSLQTGGTPPGGSPMTPPRHLLVLVLAAACGGCVPTQRAINGQGARGTEAWSWRMSATEGRWSGDGMRPGERRVAAASAAEPEPGAAAEAAPAADDAEMTLEPDHVAPAARPRALVARAAKAKRSQRVVDLKTSDSDEEFVNKIIDDNADAEDGEITMSAMALPKSKAER